jgi:hypothetical protein
MMADIKVRDKEYTQAANALANISGKLAGCVDEYCAVLAYVGANAIQDTLITGALYDISTRAAEIKATIETAASSLQSECGNYVSQIDAADTYLY